MLCTTTIARIHMSAFLKRAVFICVMFGPTDIAHAFDTRAENFSSFRTWTVTSESVDLTDRRWCRAVGEFDGNEITILRGHSDPEFGKLSLQVTMRHRQVPAGYKGSADLLLDDTTAMSGKIEDVGDWQGDKRTAFYSRATFNNMDELENRLQHTQKLTITSDASNFKSVKLTGLELEHVMSDLENCTK